MSPEYNNIRKEIAEKWPDWKRKIYNEEYALSKHAKKIKGVNNMAGRGLKANVNGLEERVHKSIVQICVYCVKTDCRKCNPIIKKFCKENFAIKPNDWDLRVFDEDGE